MKLTITSVDKRARAAAQGAARDVDDADIAAAIRADRDELSIAVLALARYCEAQGQVGRRFLKRQASRAWRREGRMLLDEARVRRRNRGWP